MVRVLGFQSRGPGFKPLDDSTQSLIFLRLIKWVPGTPGTQLSKVSCLFEMTQLPWGRWTLSLRETIKFFISLVLLLLLAKIYIVGWIVSWNICANISLGVSHPRKYGEDVFPKKCFSGGGQFFFWQIYCWLFYMVGIIIRSWQWKESFTSAFNSNLNIVNLQISQTMMEYSLDNEALTTP